MGRAAAVGRRVAAPLAPLLLVAALPGFAAPPEPAGFADSPFGLRIVQAGGPIGDDAVRRHLEFSLSAGFNAVWFTGDQAGAWTEEQAPRRPELEDEFVELARGYVDRGIRPFVVVYPVAAMRGRFVFGDPDTSRRLGKFLRQLQRKARVRDVVVSFRGAPLRMEELSDLVEFGRTTARAHVDLVARLLHGPAPGTRLWLEPAVADDARLDDSGIAYSAALRDALRGLDPSVGIVWNGPQAASTSVAASDLARTRAKLGGRRLILEDRFPANQAGGRLALALVLGPLRHRDPEIASQVAGYLACPMNELGASRLSLMTVADFLRDPVGYDADTSEQRAVAGLAGGNSGALDALRTQVLEWGGWIGERNYHTALTDNPEVAARALRDPAVVASWSWVTRRYPLRMSRLEQLADTTFRDDLLEVMARRLAVARAVPIVRELRARYGAGRSDVGSLVIQLRRERERAAEHGSAVLALDRFLAAAGLARLFEEQPDEVD